MPKQTFFHLAKEKQETLIQAAKKEFSRVPLHAASISNIIKDAKIPRGSFYQYFEDKEDLYYYLLNELGQKNHERFLSILEKKNGDLFETLIECFHCMIQDFRDPDNKSFFQNAFSNMNYKLENTLTNNVYEENKKNQLLNTIKLINTNNLNIQNEHELRYILKMMMAITNHNLVHMFVKDLSEEDALNEFIEQIQLLKRGFHKDEQ
ncbi:TetR/AcrR family transcriptional regulator [Bacillus sp. FJAT-49736]|uniref:TetR/AcrR family transcriptional regulator n=1 Tax=Bacillus sp. FJAT-49736 TaxID=2833582 RepID=UPI001BC916CA|nr:TetR/AcrR family transcriptional regulator [Bacillus sp. FJAT-49736]MBS4172720.1 TetR family transcriptional regulator [Bacillus sp. FJAT-49736]